MEETTITAERSLNWKRIMRSLNDKKMKYENYQIYEILLFAKFL